MLKELTKKCTFLIVLVFACLSVFAQVNAKDKPSIKLSGFMQATTIKAENNDAFVFGFDRVRLISHGSINKLTAYKLQIDFNKTSTDVDKDGDSPGIIKDAIITFKPNKKANISVGKFKTPIGMEFNASGKKLDIVKRGLGQTLVYERNVGAMVHGKKLGKAGLGYAFGVFNAGPNKANDVGDPAEGQDYTVAGRFSADPDKRFHGEVYFGSALTSVAGQDNVSIFGAGVRAKINEITVKGEFMSRDDAQNAGADGSDFYLQGGYLVSPRFEPIIKYEKLNVSNDSKDRGDFTLGLNIFLNPAVHHESRIQINYVLSDLDGKDSIQMMFQTAF